MTAKSEESKFRKQAYRTKIE